MALIKLENLCFEYEDSLALKDISLEINKVYYLSKLVLFGLVF